MNYKRLIAITLAITAYACTSSNAMARGGFGGGASHGGGGFLGGGGFRGNGFRHEGFHHRRFGERFFFFGEDWDQFFYNPYPYFGNYSYQYYPYEYGYDSYQQPLEQRNVASYTRSLIAQVQAPFGSRRVLPSLSRWH